MLRRLANVAWGTFEVWRKRARRPPVEEPPDEPPRVEEPSPPPEQPAREPVREPTIPKKRNL